MIAHLQGWLLVRFMTDNGQVAYMQPIGTGDIRVAVEALAADAASLGVPLRLYGLCEHWCSQLESLYPGRVANTRGSKISTEAQPYKSLFVTL